MPTGGTGADHVGAGGPAPRGESPASLGLKLPCPCRRASGGRTVRETGARQRTFGTGPPADGRDTVRGGDKEDVMVTTTTVVPDLVHGDVDEGYGPVADAFRRNFADRREVGAACAVYRNGRKVVDLWGGYRDGVRRLPWREDTVVVMYSTTKGVSSLALALAHSRGLLDYDAPVAAYWPEFAWRGKSGITVRQLLSHQAGLPVIDIPLTLADLADLDVVAAAIALQRPLWAPGTRHGYHTISLGWYEGELLRRVDPAGRSLGRFFADEIAAPLHIDFYIGLPDGFDLDRRATSGQRGGRVGTRRVPDVVGGGLSRDAGAGSCQCSTRSCPRRVGEARRSPVQPN